MLVCMVRHGQTDWNKAGLIQGGTDNPLNETGIIQAERAAGYLREHDPNWDIIVSSPLSRAYETALIIAKSLNCKCPILKDSDFKERFFGPLEGKILDAAAYAEIFKENSPGIESLQMLQSRLIRGLTALEQEFFGKKVLISSHAQSIKSVILYAKPDFDFRLPLKNSSLNYFNIEKGNIELIRFNVI